MRVADIANTTMSPAAFKTPDGDGVVQPRGTPSGTWYAGITVRGWTDGYSAWQLCSTPQINTADKQPLLPNRHQQLVSVLAENPHRRNYASMLDGRYVNAAGDSMTGDLAVRKMHLQGGNEFNCDDKLWIAYRSTPQGVNICHADQPFTYGSAGHEVLHRATTPASSTPRAAAHHTLRQRRQAHIRQHDGERYTRLSFREAGTEYAGITANSEAFILLRQARVRAVLQGRVQRPSAEPQTPTYSTACTCREPRRANAVPAYDADTMLPVSAGLNMRNDQMAETHGAGVVPGFLLAQRRRLPR